ncbi:MAG: thioredoxin [Deltaproteobacteria bacterium]|nr:MAG: thioredoxin [Deltaproteobacteria bacterium]
MTIKQFFLTITTLCVVLSSGFTPAIAGGKKIHWQPYETGIQMIKDQNKKGFLHFYTDWCHYCKIMNKQTFNDSKIIDYLNDNFISIRVNAEKQRAIARKYGVNQFPNTWFISEDSTTLSNQPGFIQPEMLLNMLKFLKTDSFKNMKFSEFINKQEQKKTVIQ